MNGGAAVGVQGDEERRKNTALGATSADGLGVRDIFPQLHKLFPVRRKSVIHVKLESGTWSWESLSCSRAGMMVLNAELESTNRILA